ncbi:hypothetical protein OPT61_g7709 [Boeremia exigua]|uniref:Uncharacterized protein n=1 Tax=Boeremia exigua TaxID=749465 RepID=A0ACC2I185_9PLEO|nr:hypothetical protein OPT61_g7709 [Boeremia exigua]
MVTKTGAVLRIYKCNGMLWTFYVVRRVTLDLEDRGARQPARSAPSSRIAIEASAACATAKTAKMRDMPMFQQKQGLQGA